MTDRPLKGSNCFYGLPTLPTCLPTFVLLWEQRPKWSYTEGYRSQKYPLNIFCFDPGKIDSFRAPREEDRFLLPIVLPLMNSTVPQYTIGRLFSSLKLIFRHKGRKGESTPSEGQYAMKNERQRRPIKGEQKSCLLLLLRRVDFAISSLDFVWPISHWASACLYRGRNSWWPKIDSNQTSNSLYASFSISCGTRRYWIFKFWYQITSRAAKTLNATEKQKVHKSSKALFGCI